ncbi:MAG: uracil-DNA glycosylase [Oscillospiraceae bacterium]|nr:uracil-DNA glycosylase [Oscillospiraceae bacterium]
MKTNTDWDAHLQGEYAKQYYTDLCAFLKQEYQTQTVYPPESDIFAALKLTPYDRVKAVILGQDPYHQPEQAHGLCFSVRQGVKLPPSLNNIFKELYADCGIQPLHGDLTQWARNGVLLLNTTLTVRRGNPNSHSKQGWTHFTDQIIRLLNARGVPTVFVLWGNHAKSKAKLLTNTRHSVLTGSHPSPLSANQGGFFGGRYFSATNAFLRAHNVPEIDWRIT